MLGYHESGAALQLKKFPTPGVTLTPGVVSVVLRAHMACRTDTFGESGSRGTCPE